MPHSASITTCREYITMQVGVTKMVQVESARSPEKADPPGADTAGRNDFSTLEEYQVFITQQVMRHNHAAIRIWLRKSVLI
jgi:hypothetical protein